MAYQPVSNVFDKDYNLAMAYVKMFSSRFYVILPVILANMQRCYF